MTRTKKLLAAGALATTVSAVALAGIASAHDRGGRDGWHQRGEHHGQMNRDHGRRGGDGWHRQGQRGDGWRGGGRQGPMHQMLGMADENNDGEISADEIAKAREGKFSQFDANSDGKLSLDEFQGLLMELMRGHTVRMFQHLDPDGDAAISKEEFDNTVNMMMQRMDRNDDGAIGGDDRRGRMGRHRGDDRPHRGMSDDRKGEQAPAATPETNSDSTDSGTSN